MDAVSQNGQDQVIPLKGDLSQSSDPHEEIEDDQQGDHVSAQKQQYTGTRPMQDLEYKCYQGDKEGQKTEDQVNSFQHGAGFSVIPDQLQGKVAQIKNQHA